MPRDDDAELEAEVEALEARVYGARAPRPGGLSDEEVHRKFTELMDRLAEADPASPEQLALEERVMRAVFATQLGPPPKSSPPALGDPNLARLVATFHARVAAVYAMLRGPETAVDGKKPAPVLEGPTMPKAAQAPARRQPAGRGPPIVAPTFIARSW